MQNFLSCSILWVLLAFTLKPLSASVIGIDTLHEFDIPQIEADDPTIFFLDINDTLIDSSCMVGSKKWRKYIRSQVSQEIFDAIVFFATRYLPVAAMESSTSEFVAKLQSAKAAVRGVTARERDKWRSTPIRGIDLLTEVQLQSVGIDFARPSQEIDPSYLPETSEYFAGIYFVGTELKGDYLQKLWQDSSVKPKKVIFIDDRLDHVESVDHALQSLGIESLCYHYTLSEQKAAQFDPLIANIQLYFFCYFNYFLTDDEAAEIAENPLTKPADVYFSEILNWFHATGQITLPAEVTF